ncbi:hypothetical protein N7451_008977 [Penicillium sp. IBT 35674x]|nr:hypothetical protein N7451_008977 [Penicillium sp. IBT 35674x]
MWCPLTADIVFGFGVLVSSYQHVAAAFENHPASTLASSQMFRLLDVGVMDILVVIMFKILGLTGLCHCLVAWLLFLCARDQ